MFKAILFDFDGTLLDSDQMIFEAFKILYQKYKPEVDADFSHTLTFWWLSKRLKVLDVDTRKPNVR